MVSPWQARRVTRSLCASKECRTCGERLERYAVAEGGCVACCAASLLHLASASRPVQERGA